MTTLAQVHRLWSMWELFVDYHSSLLFGWTSEDAQTIKRAYQAIGVAYVADALISRQAAAALPLDTLLDPDPDPQKKIKDNLRTRAAIEQFMMITRQFRVRVERSLTKRRKPTKTS